MSKVAAPGPTDSCTLAVNQALANRIATGVDVVTCWESKPHAMRVCVDSALCAVSCVESMRYT